MSDAEAGGSDPIYLLDDLRLKPGMLEVFLEAMQARYRPDAEARGQELIHIWVTPPTTTEGVSLSVMLVWRVAGVPGFWRMRSQNATEGVAAWWAECDGMIESRSRRFAASPESIPAFEAMGRLNA